MLLFKTCTIKKQLRGMKRQKYTKHENRLASCFGRCIEDLYSRQTASESVLWFSRKIRTQKVERLVGSSLTTWIPSCSRPGLFQELFQEQEGLLSTMNSAMLQREIMQSFKLRGLGVGRDSLNILLDHLNQHHSYKDELSRIVDHVVGSSECEYP
jgi:hypothetical protein